mgnify:CR=1 FL=1
MDNNRSVEELIGTLYDMVQDAWNVPMSGNKCVLERDQVQSLLDEISANLPGELKQARTIVEARNEVITNAKKEAETIRRAAEDRARKMVSRDEIVQQAQKQAAEIIKSAEAKVNELKHVTNTYVEDSLKEAEEAVAKTLSQVRETRSKFTAMTNPRASKPSPIIEDI